jgi:hypothetical protein
VRIVKQGWEIATLVRRAPRPCHASDDVADGGLA